MENCKRSVRSGLCGGSFMTWAATSWYSADPIVQILIMRMTVSISSTKFSPWPANTAIFQDDNAPIHTAKTVQSWSNERQNITKHLPWPVRSPDVNIFEPKWGVFEQIARSRFPPPTSLKRLADILVE